MTLSLEQKELFAAPSSVPNTVFVNDRVTFQTEDKQRVILVQGVVFSHYSLEDCAAEAYALISLFESGYADQNNLTRCFGYSTRTLRRYQERLKSGGLSTLARPRGRPYGSVERKPMAARDRTILRLKAKGNSNRWIGGRLGLDEKIIRKSLRRLGWKPDPEPALPLLLQGDSPAPPVTIQDGPHGETTPCMTPPLLPQMAETAARHPTVKSLDANPLPARVPLAQAQKGQALVKLSSERKHLTNVLKMVAYQIESDLVELIRPY